MSAWANVRRMQKAMQHDFVSAIVYHSSAMVDNHGYKIISEKTNLKRGRYYDDIHGKIL